MKCNYCGNINAKENKACVNCGKPLKKENPKIVGIICFILGILTLISVPFFVLIFSLGEIINNNNDLSDNNLNKFIGTWDCYSYDGSGASEEKIVKFGMNKDGSFTWSKYDDQKNNYVNGNYSFETLLKTNASGNTTYYKITLQADDFVVNGIKKNEKYYSEYEVGYVMDEYGKNDGIIMYNLSTTNMYWCEK